jgi:cell division protein FtsN
VVNAASFTTKDEAKGLAKALKLAGYKSYVTEFTKDDTQWYRVRAGFFSTQSDAEKAAEKIKTQFKIDTPWVVRPAKKELSKYARP